MEKMRLVYNNSMWEEVKIPPYKSLQVSLYEGMTFSEYKSILDDKVLDVQNVIITGEEPTLNKDLRKIIELNNLYSLKTIIYTEGHNLSSFFGIDISKVELRVEVLGKDSSEKPLSKVHKTSLPITIVYMLNKENISELKNAAAFAEKVFRCNSFYLSSMGDIGIKEYKGVIENFMFNHSGNLDSIHIGGGDTFEKIVLKRRWMEVRPTRLCEGLFLTEGGKLNMQKIKTLMKFCGLDSCS